MPQSDQCVGCAHFIGGVPLTCDAFPEMIPMEIVTGEFNHAKPYPGDRGIRWAPVRNDKPLVDPV